MSLAVGTLVIVLHAIPELKGRVGTVTHAPAVRDVAHPVSLRDLGTQLCVVVDLPETAHLNVAGRTEWAFAPSDVRPITPPGGDADVLVHDLEPDSIPA